MREKAAEAQTLKKKVVKTQKKVKKSEDDVNDLPEVDQNTKKLITQRPTAKTSKIKH